jgi:hypothetical protein
MSGTPGPAADNAPRSLATLPSVSSPASAFANPLVTASRIQWPGTGLDKTHKVVLGETVLSLVRWLTTSSGSDDVIVGAAGPSCYDPLVMLAGNPLGLGGGPEGKGRRGGQRSEKREGP